jgi:hypothetical protein
VRRKLAPEGEVRELDVPASRCTPVKVFLFLLFFFLLWGGGVCGTCYDFFINHLTSITLASALLTDV